MVDQVTPAAPVEILRTSLAEALRIYYPFAGRLKNHNTSVGKKLYIDCNNAGEHRLC